MRKITLILVSFGLLLFMTISANAGNFTLKSTDLSGQLTLDQVYSGFGCTGNNISPELQ